MSGLVEGHSEAPDGSQLAKPVAKELFPACKPARDEDGEPLKRLVDVQRHASGTYCANSEPVRGNTQNEYPLQEESPSSLRKIARI